MFDCNFGKGREKKINKDKEMNQMIKKEGNIYIYIIYIYIYINIRISSSYTWYNFKECYTT